MGASTSRIDEDKALQLCRERKKFVQQALDGRCLLAAAHVSYVQSLRSTGTALRRFAETEVPVESSLYTSTSATPEQALALTEKSVSHLSYSPPPSSPPPPPSSSPFQVNHMKFRGFSSKKVEEKPPVPVVATVSVTSSSSVPRSRSMEKMESSTPFEESSSTPPPWDYFGLSHPIDNQFSSPPVPPRVGNGHVSSSVKGEDEETREVEEEEEEEDGENFSFQEREESNNGSDDDDEFDEPTSDTLVRSFENFNRVRQREGAESEKSKTPELSPPVTPLAAATPLNKTPNHTENNRLPPPRDFLSSMKEVEMLFVRASETGKEVPRMLEANKLHFRPIAQSNQSSTGASSLFKTCLSCGEDPKDVPEEEAAPNTMKYLTWHRTESSRSSSSLNPPLGGMNSDDVEELNSNLFENIGIIAGSHASTLDRLYAWERKLYDEVKGSQAVRREYDDKCKILRELESEGKGSKIIDKTRSVVKDLHSRIRVAIHRIDSISRRIEELRDNELQPQLEELIQGLSRMWEVMFECHKAQFQLISACHRRGNIKLNMQSELHRQVTSHLESELSALASSLTKWITGQRSYIKAIHEWLEKCVVLPRPSKRKRRAHQQPVLRNLGPPIYATCAIWLEKLEALPAKEVSGSNKALASDVARFLPRQEKNRSKKHGSDHMLRDETLEDCGPGFDRFRTSLEVFAGQLNQFAESSVKMYEELEQGIQEAKISYEQWRVANGGFL